MGAEQDEAKPLVHHLLAGVGHRALGLLGELGLDGEQRQRPGPHGLGAQPVDDATPGGGQQPGGRVGRVAVAGPGPGRGLEGVAEAVLGEIEAAVLRDEQGQQPAPLVAQGVLEGCGHAMSAWPDEWSTVGRTSIAPSAPASSPTTCSRSSRSSVSTM
jgi:hypothetical protein